MEFSKRMESAVRRPFGLHAVACSALALVLFGCGSGGAGDQSDGFGSVVMAMSSTACTAFNDATVIDRIDIGFSPSTAPLTSLSFTRAQIIDHCASPGDPLSTFDDVPSGAYSATAEAFRDDDVLVGQGNESFEVYHGETTDVTITLEPVSGEGNLTVDIDIDGDWSGLEGSGD